jgi:hypothetical protein
MAFNFDWPLLIVGLIFSAAGFVYFSYGKRTQSFNIMMCGMALMVYTYFVDSMAASIIIGLVLSALPFILKWW